jgi:hypothetical protein
MHIVWEEGLVSFWDTSQRVPLGTGDVVKYVVKYVVRYVVEYEVKCAENHLVKYLLK